MTCRDCVKLTIYADGIDTRIYTQILNPPHDMLVHLADLDYERNKDIGTLKKERRDIFSECFTEIFKEKFLCSVNEVLF